DGDMTRLGRALAAGRHGERDELMAHAAAYSGLRWGELTALTIGQADQAARVITVDRKVVEVAGHLYVESRTTSTPASLIARRRRSSRPAYSGCSNAGLTAASSASRALSSLAK